jgi:L-ascorbate metabolism protein UlaG (beta-lactamase superfamily)
LRAVEAAQPEEQELRLRRLGWAGLEISVAGSTLVVDLLEDLGSMSAWVGGARTELPAPCSPVDVALVTHLHTDHADGPALGRRLAPGALLLRPEPAAGEGLETIALAEAEGALAELDAETHTLSPWESFDAGPFRCTAVPAADGFGDPQVSWVVEAAGRRILHGGDTLFHGSWWLTAMRAGPIDVAFLPVNGARCDFPHRQPPSPYPAVMDPEQAAVAAQLLGTELAVPIHYETIHAPPLYAEVEAPAEAFAEAAGRRGVEARIVDPGEAVEPAPVQG